MRFVVLDAETFFSDDFTLSKMSTEAYIRDPRFIALGAAIKWGPDEAAQWYDERRLRQVLGDEDWSDVCMIHHHAQFDGLILSHHYDVHPKMFGCTLSMARLLLGNHISVSLDSVRKQFGLPAKLTPYHLFRGKHWNEIPAEHQRLIGEGACDECESIWTLFTRMLTSNSSPFPRFELGVVDNTIKLFTEPVLRGDIDLLGKLWADEVANKNTRMELLWERICEMQGIPLRPFDDAAKEIVEANLQSSERFAALLRDAGVEPMLKQGKKKLTYAFAKTDAFMRELQESDDEELQMLAEARLSAKSTQALTRAETFGWMARRGPMPVYIKSYGAHTTRDSGGDGANWQNLKRTDPDNPKRNSPLRRSIMAPEGFLLGPVDLSQIECRLLNYLAGQEDVVENFRDGRDPYVGIASEFYGRQITKEDKEERGTGKQAELSCGFGCGDKKFKSTAALGIYGPPVHLNLVDAKRMVQLYRSTHPAICAREVGYWAQAGRLIARLAGGEPIEWGPVLIKDKRVYRPGGTFLIYDTLEYHVPDDEEKEKLLEFKWEGFWRFRTRDGWTDLYHSKFVENVIQWLAREVMMEALLRIEALGYRVVMRTHDELVVLIPKDGREQQHLQVCIDEMKRTPAWLPGIPLDCEGSLGERYSK